MTIEKLKYQIEQVLRGESNLQQAAHNASIDIDGIEEKIKVVLSQGVIFSGDYIQDMMMTAYWVGRRMQFVASMGHLFGQDELKKTYNECCLKMGINKRLN